MKVLELNDGLLSVYALDRVKGDDNVYYESGRLLFRLWFRFMGIGATEYYLDKQAKERLVSRVRVHQNRKIVTKNMIIIDGKQYEVGRVYHGLNDDNDSVTDISLERPEKTYDLE